MHTIRSLACALLALPLLATAQDASKPAKALSLADCLQIALEHNLDVKIERLGPQIAQYNVKLAYAGYEPEFSAGGNHDYRQDPGGLDDQNRAYAGSETETDSFNAGIRGLLPTGLNYSLTGSVSDSTGTKPGFTTVIENGITNLVPIRLPFENSSGQWGFLTLRQPLLKNMWIDSTRLNIRVTKNRLKYSDLTLRQRIMNIATSVEVAYYDLIRARENVKAQEQALQLADRLLAENRKRVEVGAMAPLDEKDAERQVAQARATLLSVRNNLSTQQNNLKALLSENFSEWQEVSVEPSEGLRALPQTFALQDSWQKGLSSRPDILQSKLDLERIGYVLKYQKNQLFPQLDLVGTYGHRANSVEYSGLFDSFGRMDGPFYSYGATISVPLGNRSARNNLKTSKAQEQQLLLVHKRLEQTIMIDIDDAIKQAMSDFERVDATKKAREFAEAALEAEQKKLENGKSTSYFVLRLQNDLTVARFNEIGALADYNRALAQLALSEGATLERNNLSVEVR